MAVGLFLYYVTLGLANYGPIPYVTDLVKILIGLYM